MKKRGGQSHPHSVGTHRSLPPRPVFSHFIASFAGGDTSLDQWDQEVFSQSLSQSPASALSPSGSSLEDMDYHSLMFSVGRTDDEDSKLR